MPAYVGLDDLADEGSGSGSSLSSIISSLSQLGQTAILAYAPMNAGAGVNPQGEAVRYNTMGATSSSSGLTTLLILGIAILGGVWAFKQL